MSSYFLGSRLRLGNSKNSSKMRQHSSVKRAVRFFLSNQRFWLSEETPEIFSTYRTSGATMVRGMHSMPTGPQPRLKSSMGYMKRPSKSCRSLFQSRRSKRRVPSKMVRLAYKLCAPKAFPRAPVIMDYSTLESFLSAHTPQRGKTRWSSTTSSMYPLHFQTTKSKSLSSKLARKNISTSAKMRRSTASATQAYVAHGSLVLEQTVLMRLR
jgi:hypothetical protein